jgi:hypothetical protein
MANHNFIPRRDPEYLNWLDILAKGVAADPASFNVPQAKSDALTAASLDFDTKYHTHLGAQDKATAATKGKNTSRDASEVIVREVAGTIQANSNVTPEQKENLGLPVHDTIHSVVHAHTPENLKFEGGSDGVNRGDWDAGENPQGMMYSVEAQYAEDQPFVLVDVVKKTSYNHKGQTPGVRITYQVRAKHREELSSPSNAATVFANNTITPE